MTQDTARAAAIPTIQRYIANLSAVPAASRTAAQQASLGLYQARLGQYMAAATPTVAPGVITPMPTPPIATAPTQYQATVLPDRPVAWGAPISLAAPSTDTYQLAQQYYYALRNPGLSGPDRSTLFNQPNMTNQLQQLLMSTGSTVATSERPGYIRGANAGGFAYPDVPAAVYQQAGVSREQFTPESFYGGQVARQGYSLAVDPTIIGANEQAAVRIPYLQAEIAQGTATATGQRLTPAQISARRRELAGLQAGWRAATANQVYPLTYGGQTVAPGGGNASSLLPAPVATSLLTPQGSATPYATAPIQTGVGGAPAPAAEPVGGPPISVSGGGGSDAGSPAIGGPYPMLAGPGGGASLLELAVLGGGALAVVYTMKQRKTRGKKG